MVEHSTADREVPGSNPGVPYIFWHTLSYSFPCFYKGTSPHPSPATHTHTHTHTHTSLYSASHEIGCSRKAAEVKRLNVYSRTWMARTPWKFILDMGGSSHRVNHSARLGDKNLKNIWNVFSIFYKIMVCWVYSLESPHRGDSNDHTQHTFYW